MNSTKIKKYLDIQKHIIKVKKDAELDIDLTQYKKIEEMIIDIENQKYSVIQIPGFFEVIFPDEMDSLTFTFTYKVYINISNINERTSQNLKVSFKAGEILLYVEVIDTETDMRLIESMFEGSVKYLTKDIYKRIVSTFDQMQKINDIQFAHIELLYSQLYAVPINGEFIPLRLTGKEYKPEYLINTKNSSHLLNGISGISYGFTNDFLISDMTKKKKKAKSDMEHILSNTYNQLQSKTNLGKAPEPFNKD